MFNKIKNFFGVEDNEEEEEEIIMDEFTNASDIENGAEYTKENLKKNKKNQNNNVKNNLTNIALYEPRIFSDAKTIVQQVLIEEAAIVNFGSIDEDQARRIIDFMSGAAEAINGDVTRISERIFIFTPKNFQISGPDVQNLSESFK